MVSPVHFLLGRSRSCLCGPWSRYYSPWHTSISKYDVLSPEYHRTFGEPSFGPCTLKAAPMTRRDPAAAPWGSGCPLCASSPSVAQMAQQRGTLTWCSRVAFGPGDGPLPSLAVHAPGQSSPRHAHPARGPGLSSLHNDPGGARQEGQPRPAWPQQRGQWPGASLGQDRLLSRVLGRRWRGRRWRGQRWSRWLGGGLCRVRGLPLGQRLGCC